MKRYFVTFVARQQYEPGGYLMFQGFIEVPFDLDLEISKCKSDKEITLLWDKVFEKNDMKIWMSYHKDYIPKRIMCWQLIQHFKIETEVLK